MGAPFLPSGRVHRRRPELPSILGRSMRTPRNLPSTGWTSEDEALYYTAQVFGGLLSGVNPQPIRRRIATRGIGEDLVVTGPCRRELARQSGDANCAVGKTPRHVSTPTTGVLAVGNSVGRQKAKRKNAPKWRPLDSGSMYLSMKAIYFQTTSGLSPWPYDGIDYAHMVGRGVLEFGAVREGNDTVEYRVFSPWSELALILWALARSIPHPHLLNLFPPEWRSRALARGLVLPRLGP
jgi:hypothetical protein